MPVLECRRPHGKGRVNVPHSLCERLRARGVPVQNHQLGSPARCGEHRRAPRCAARTEQQDMRAFRPQIFSRKHGRHAGNVGVVSDIALLRPDQRVHGADQSRLFAEAA